MSNFAGKIVKKVIWNFGIMKAITSCLFKVVESENNCVANFLRVKMVQNVFQLKGFK